MKQRRLRWLGQVDRMEDGRLPKDILYGEFYNASRKTGRLKLRYEDVIKRYTASFHISPQSRETLAANRNRWRSSGLWLFIVSHNLHRKMEKCRPHRRQPGWAMTMMMNQQQIIFSMRARTNISTHW